LNLYVESNFLLELVLGQREYLACEQLLSNTGRDYEIVLPASCLLEAQYKFVARERNAKELGRQLRTEIDQLSRTRFQHESSLLSTSPLSELLVRTAEHYRHRYTSLLDEISNSVRVLPMDANCISLAKLSALRYELELPDALVLASILNDIDAQSENESVFVTTDRDFSRPSIQNVLRGKKCLWLQSFEGVLDRINHRR